MRYGTGHYIKTSRPLLLLGQLSRLSPLKPQHTGGFFTGKRGNGHNAFKMASSKLGELLRHIVIRTGYRRVGMDFLITGP